MTTLRDVLNDFAMEINDAASELDAPAYMERYEELLDEYATRIRQDFIEKEKKA